MSLKTPPLAVTWRKPHSVLFATLLFLLVFWIPYDLHSGNTPFPLQTCLAHLSTTQKGNLIHFSEYYGYKVPVPSGWVGRSHVYKTALQSCGFTPVAKKNSPSAPEVVIAVNSAPRHATLESVVTPRMKPNTYAQPVQIGNRQGLRYRTKDDKLMVSAFFQGKEYDIILSSVKTDKHTKARFEKIVQNFRFIEV